MKLEVARPLGQVVLVVALFLIAAPVVNVGLQVFPFRPGSQNWRFGALGFFLGAITLPTFGLALIVVGGILRDSVAVVRVGLILTSLFALVTVLGLADFLLESRALRRAATDPKMAALVDFETQRTVIVSIVAIPALAAICVWSYKLVRELKSAVAVAEGSSPLIRAGGR